DATARGLIPSALARRLYAVGLTIHGSGATRSLMVAMRDPGDLAAIDELTFATGMRIDARIAPETSLRTVLEHAGVLGSDRNTPVPTPPGTTSGAVPTVPTTATTGRIATGGAALPPSGEDDLGLELALETEGSKRARGAASPP